MNKHNPIRHHYIPQFILRTFANDNGLFNYWDNKKKVLIKIAPSDVFMNKHMYTSTSINDDHFIV